MCVCVCEFVYFRVGISISILIICGIIKEHYLPPGVFYTTGFSHNPFINFSQYEWNEIITPKGSAIISYSTVFENVDIACFISIFCQRIRVINGTFNYTADTLEIGEKHCKTGNSQEK